jgi:hypothetical protein
LLLVTSTRRPPPIKSSGGKRKEMAGEAGGERMGDVEKSEVVPE